jgi:hypothetical protein
MEPLSSAVAFTHRRRTICANHRGRPEYYSIKSFGKTSSLKGRKPAMLTILYLQTVLIEIANTEAIEDYDLNVTS